MNFPVVTLLKNDKLIYASPDEKTLKKASIDVIDIFKEATIVDSDGIEYIISAAYKTKWATILWGYHPLQKGRTGKIEFQIQKQSKIEVDQFKMVIKDRVNQKFSSHLYFDLTKDQLLELIDRASSINELIKIFLFYDPATSF